MTAGPKQTIQRRDGRYTTAPARESGILHLKNNAAGRENLPPAALLYLDGVCPRHNGQGKGAVTDGGDTRFKDNVGEGGGLIAPGCGVGGGIILHQTAAGDGQDSVIGQIPDHTVAAGARFGRRGDRHGGKGKKYCDCGGKKDAEPPFDRFHNLSSLILC